MAKNVITIPATISKFTASPLVSRKKRKVAAYARVSCDKDTMLHSLAEQVSKYSRMILQSLKRLFEKNKNKKVRATFWQTVEAVSKQNKVGKEEVANSLRALIARGYVYQVKESEKPDSIRVLKVNWQQVYKDRLL